MKSRGGIGKQEMGLGNRGGTGDRAWHRGQRMGLGDGEGLDDRGKLVGHTGGFGGGQELTSRETKLKDGGER